ncbi:MAG TPA: hypothetical protein EYP77_00985 [Anaerolineae bacterium]|nr:hypothetical protein [Anaerolineae bacterium]
MEAHPGVDTPGPLTGLPGVPAPPGQDAPTGGDRRLIGGRMGNRGDAAQGHRQTGPSKAVQQDAEGPPPPRPTSPLLRWLPALAWMGLIFALSAQPDLPHAPRPWLDTLLKKGGHAVAYGVLAWLYLRALRGSSARDQARPMAALLAVAYALTDELHQAFVPGRHPSPVDVLIDGAGALLAMALEQWRTWQAVDPFQ